ncbi:thetaTry [Trypoxylus dichotomus]
MGAVNATKSTSERRIRKAIQHAMITAGDDDSKSWRDNSTMAALNNVGLLLIDKPFALGPTIQIINIASYSHAYEGRAALIAGWGELCYTDTFSYDKLLVAEIVLGRNSHGILHRELTKDRCYGDSGSPVVLESEVIGLVVCGYNCQNFAGLLPNFFIEIYPHLKWITLQTGGILASCPTIN